MDKAILALLIPVLALATGFVAVLKMPRKAFGRQSDPEVDARLQALEQEIGALRQDLIEVHERLDFAERILARGEEARRIGKEL